MRVHEGRWQAPRRREEDRPDAARSDAARAEELREELDGILDEIDDLLEENAEEFVKGYVQKGGE